MTTISKREFNHQMARVLDQTRTTKEPAIITERGVPHWKVIPYEPSTDGRLAELVRQGRAIGAETGPIPWDQIDQMRRQAGVPPYTKEQIDALVHWTKGDR